MKKKNIRHGDLFDTIITNAVSTLTAALRDLLKKDVECIWNECNNLSFQTIKDILIYSPVLAYFSTNVNVNAEQVDASKYGTGAALLQEGRG